jgi:predicted permease
VPGKNGTRSKLDYRYDRVRLAGPPLCGPVLGRNRLFASAAIGTLAVAIGANTAIFSLIDAAFLRPLPYPEPSRLIFLCEGQPSVTYSFSYPRYEMLRDQASAFEGIAAYDDESITASTSGEPERIEGGRVSANFFSVLRVQPILGRAFTPDEDRAAGPPLVMLSHHYWESHFNSDPNVVDRTLRIDGIAHSIIGVLPAGFQFLGEPVDVWRSRMADTGTFFPSSVRRGARYLTVIGRLKQGAGINQAQASLAVLDARYRRDYPGNDDRDVSVYATPLQQQLVSGSLRLNLFVAWGAVSCLLLIAAANIANLLLSRAAARRKEISVRLAIGASRWRVARQLLTESALIALCGGVAQSIPRAVGRQNPRRDHPPDLSSDAGGSHRRHGSRLHAGCVPLRRTHFRTRSRGRRASSGDKRWPPFHETHSPPQPSRYRRSRAISGSPRRCRFADAEFSSACAAWPPAFNPTRSPCFG